MTGFSRHRRSGRVFATFTGFEADLLRSLAAQLVELLRNETAAPVEQDPLEALLDFSGPTTEPDDPVLARLFPSAYREDEEAAGDFRRYTEGTLRDGKTASAVTIIDTLEEAGFKAGAIGNAPEGSDVPRAEVHAKTADRSKAQLVALALGKNTQVVVDDEQDLGPGIDVYIGDKFKRLDPNAPMRVKLDEPRIECG